MDKLNQHRESKVAELNALNAKTGKQLWIEDLIALKEALQSSNVLNLDIAHSQAKRKSKKAN